MASAILFFILNLIGLGMGPSAVGFLSDYLEPTYGVESLRYAMVFLDPCSVVLVVLPFRARDPHAARRPGKRARLMLHGNY